MATGTYARGDKLLGRFSEEARKKYDRPGKLIAADFFEKQGYNVLENDLNADGTTNTEVADLQAIRSDCNIYVEAEIKDNYGWGFIKQGIHVTARKEKYLISHKGDRLLFVSTKEDLTELAVIASLYMQLALNAGRIDHIPEHGCRIFRKNTNRSDEPEDFFEVAYARIDHYQMIYGEDFHAVDFPLPIRYERIHKADRRYMNGH